MHERLNTELSSRLEYRLAVIIANILFFLEPTVSYVVPIGLQRETPDCSYERSVFRNVVNRRQGDRVQVRAARRVRARRALVDCIIIYQVATCLHGWKTNSSQNILLVLKTDSRPIRLLVTVVNVRARGEISKVTSCFFTEITKFSALNS